MLKITRERPGDGRLVIRRSSAPLSSPWFHTHAHSRFSAGDALPSPAQMAAVAAAHGQPALALTDHGNMAGAVQLYKACRKEGILPFPGLEAYLALQPKSTQRYHVGLLATSLGGYEALVRLCSRTHSRESFHHKPLLTFADLAEWKERGWTEGLAITTGCYFGLLVQTLVREGREAARAVIQRYAFLVPLTLIELQRHQIDHGEDVLSEAEIASALADLADEVGLPVVLTQDAHYCDAADQPLHDAFKRVVAFGDDLDEAVFPGDGFHLSDAAWVRAHHEDRHWVKGEEGIQTLLHAHQLTIPELDNYQYSVPQIVAKPQEVLARLCDEQITARGLSGVYRERTAEELDIIASTGMAGYLLMVKEVTDHMTSEGIFFQARGSASGSLVCWLLGITQVNPIRYHLTFGRFLSRDRTKPPDIDLDVEDARRQEVLAWVAQRFSAIQIGSWSEFGVNEEGKGSLIIAYKKIARARGIDPSTITTLSDAPVEIQTDLRALSERKVLKAYGVHPAGVVVTAAQRDWDRLVPTMLVASSGSVVTQFNGDDIEALGLVKLDVLGLRTLSLLRRTVELLGRDLADGLDFIPLTDAQTFTLCRKGATEGIFQLEGGTASRGCREMGIRSLKDIIVLQALYRPAVMRSGGKDDYIARRNGVSPAPEFHPLLRKHLDETFGVVLFQEQVISILRDLGFSPDDLTRFLKAVKASNKNVGDAGAVIASFKEATMTAAEQAGVPLDQREWLWSALEGFGEYAFNRAHATTYGMTAYRQAYLKTHHPLEFATALLETSAGTVKEADYISAVRRMGIRIRSPHVNISGSNYSIDRKTNSVRKGLLSIKGVGVKAAEEIAGKAPYESIADLAKRVEPRAVPGAKAYLKDGDLRGVLGKLADANALEGLA